MASNTHDINSLMQGLDSKSRNLIGKIVAHLKSQGNFDELRKDCLEELDKMESFRQLNQRVESYVATFLSKQEWSDTLSKNQMRDSLRKHVVASETLQTGAQRLVTQVIEKRSRAFQTRLEGIVQNFIYMDKEKERKERQARYQGWHTSQQDSSFNKPDQDKASTSGISDVNDIISQIEHREVELNKNESSGGVKSEALSSSQRDIHSKSDSGALSKPEQVKHEKKTDISSPIDATKNTPPSKSNIAKRSIQSKRVIPRIGSSPKASSPSDKSTGSPSRAKHVKASNTESQQKLDNEGVNVEAAKKVQEASSVVKIPSVSQETGQNLQDTDLKKDDANIKIKVDDKQDTDITDIKDNENTATIITEKEQDTEPVPAAENIVENPTDLGSEIQQTSDVQINESKTSAYDDRDEPMDTQKPSLLKESDIDDSVSDVSSVHTSDLSSFDGEVSSISDSDNDYTEEGQQNLKNKPKKKGISPELNDEKIKTGKGRSKDVGRKDDSGKKPKRGRPRKHVVAGASIRADKPEERHSRSRHRDDDESGDSVQGRNKSKRTIKKKRFYSPSSEGTREVCLPSKRSRVSSRD